MGDEWATEPKVIQQVSALITGIKEVYDYLAQMRKKEAYYEKIKC